MYMHMCIHTRAGDVEAGGRDALIVHIHMHMHTHTRAGDVEAGGRDALIVLEDLHRHEPLPAYQRAAAAGDQCADEGQHLLRPPALARRGAQDPRQRVQEGVSATARNDLETLYFPYTHTCTCTCACACACTRTYRCPPRRAMTSRPSTFHTHIHIHAHAHVHVHAHVHTGVRHGAQ